MDEADLRTKLDPVKCSTSEQEKMQDQTVDDGDDRIADAAAAARSTQPTGNTFLTTKVCLFLLKFLLREYQHIGLDLLVTMYEQRLNGDEMGLGKTIMMIVLRSGIERDLNLLESMTFASII
ncbi:hypothetical protein L6452_02858 [Arctium lappa]|uniref:Uncharacterized protein n=1 Tax=Arctium lappa TaxID=4217 RepID=A0ACB9FLI4_ARCLA|nr:hypothetical protein L6452_02858 [Arctium lappa]